ncbi:uncharacterized protein PAC_05218 [Phialocephala subalpina]|uniref:Uncharacterized protein n=1 Tax=Phialocephala subalpina TaxID=576137 RepID=A0A1L7WRD3_9HELO|nr:uncharacterized protein PAC_05218 [Phialocephala subalpina]
MFRIPHFRRKWKWPNVLIILMILELGGTVAALALFGIADPDLYRTRLWTVGANNGFNSSPTEILYAYANHRPIPSIPFVWSQTLTSFNVAISVLSMFILLVKVVMFTLHCWYPLLGTITNAVITALWIVSMYGQMGPDHSDPKHKSNIAWYITKSCSYADATGDHHYCSMAKGTYATTVLMMVIFFLNFLLGIYSLIPSAGERAASKIEVDDMQMKRSPVSSNGDGRSDKEWEMKAVPKTPYTPRTLAFNTLDRQLPLRATTAPDPRWAR